MAQSICHREKTIHANLPPQTGGQLGQSGGGIIWSGEGSEKPGADCSTVIYSSRTMMAAWVSTDGEALTAPAQTAQTHLTSTHWCACMSIRVANTHTHTHNHQNTLCVSHKGAGINLPVLLCELNMSPRLLTLCASITTHKPKQFSRLLPIKSAQIKWETTIALQQHM